MRLYLKTTRVDALEKAASASTSPLSGCRRSRRRIGGEPLTSHASGEDRSARASDFIRSRIHTRRALRRRPRVRH